MKIFLNLKPLSVNAAFQGRRFKTKECRQYDKTLDIALMPFKRDIVRSDWYAVQYSFFLRNFSMTDGDNMVKVLQDALVRNGFLSDDRRIKRFIVEKFKAETDSIRVEIVPCEDN